MTITTRRYQQDDIETMLYHIGKHLENSVLKDIRYDRAKMKMILENNLKNTQFFANIALSDNEIIGGFCASVTQYLFSQEVFANDNFFYTVPENRHTIKTATALVGDYIKWAEQRKVREALLSTITGYKPEKFTKFAERLGFTLIGNVHTKEIYNGKP